jgi:hypothetical protein
LKNSEVVIPNNQELRLKGPYALNNFIPARCFRNVSVYLKVSKLPPNFASPQFID